MTDLWLLTVAPAERVAEVEDLIESLGIENNVVVAHSPTFLRTDKATVVDYPYEDFNISGWWDFGLNCIGSQYFGESAKYDVLMIESDVRMSRDDVETIRHLMRAHDTVLAGADWQNCLQSDEVKVRRDNSVWIAEGKEAWQSRLPGMAMVVAGEAHIRHDPLMPRFWYSDDHFEWNSRVGGGTLLVGGTTIHHTGTQGPLKGDLLRYAEEDSVEFEKYWGGHPSLGGIPDA